MALFNRVDDIEKWGNAYNATPSGMMRKLVEKEADIAICRITPREDLHRSFDFTIQYMQVGQKGKLINH